MIYTPYHKADYRIILHKNGIASVAGYAMRATSASGASVDIGIDRRNGYWYITELSTGRAFGTGCGYKTRKQAAEAITDHQIDTVAAYLIQHPEIALPAAAAETMKKYYIHYYKNFVNAYELWWAETPAQKAIAKKKGYAPITRREAEKKCAEENSRRKRGEGGFAYRYIYPVDCNWEVIDATMDIVASGYILEYKNASIAAKAAEAAEPAEAAV